MTFDLLWLGARRSRNARPVLESWRPLAGRLVDGVLEFADGLLGRADNLVGHAFGLKLPIADGLADGLLGGANGLLRRAFDTLPAHGLVLCCNCRPACASPP